MKNYYAEAIASLESQNLDFRRIVFEIAKRNPKALVDALKRINPVVEPKWVQECRDLIKADQFIAAIKHYRTMSGAGLKEAKDACDALRS